jgi:hypothetical protein
MSVECKYCHGNYAKRGINIHLARCREYKLAKLKAYREYKLEKLKAHQEYKPAQSQVTIVNNYTTINNTFNIQINQINQWITETYNVISQVEKRFNNLVANQRSLLTWLSPVNIKRISHKIMNKIAQEIPEAREYCKLIQNKPYEIILPSHVPESPEILKTIEDKCTQVSKNITNTVVNMATEDGLMNRPNLRKLSDDMFSLD